MHLCYYNINKKGTEKPQEREEKEMKKNENQLVADKLDGMELSSRAREIIVNTDISVMAEVFGGLETTEEVESYIRENYPDAVDKICALYGELSESPDLNIESEDGERLENVYILGNDECYKCNEFFQYIVDGKTRKVYRAFYEVPEIDGDVGLDQIAYSKPYRLEDVTEEFEE